MLFQAKDIRRNPLVRAQHELACTMKTSLGREVTREELTLENAIKFGKITLIRRLLENGDDPNQKDSKGIKLLDYAACTIMIRDDVILPNLPYIITGVNISDYIVRLFLQHGAEI